jgi:2'-5' RNA ligase
MRLFAALPVTGDATVELTALIGELERTDWPVRWVKPAGLHLTVKFLGETDPGRVPEIEASLRLASRWVGMITLAAGELGAFPGLTGARVLWAGFVSEPALELLAHRIEQGCAGLGFPVAGRPFRPHVTIGRVREGRTLTRTATEVLELRRLRNGFSADRLVLYESVTGSGPAEYRAVATISLGA